MRILVHVGRASGALSYTMQAKLYMVLLPRAQSQMHYIYAYAYKYSLKLASLYIVFIFEVVPLDKLN